MHKTMTENWNKVVGDDDLIFILGDFCFDQKTQWAKYLKLLKGKKYLILGNHDNKVKDFNGLGFEMVCDMLQLWAYNPDTDKHDKFFLCHYPVLSFPGMFQGFVHCYGHCHTRDHNTGADAGILQYMKNAYDVGVDGNNFTPIERNEVIQKICLK